MVRIRLRRVGGKHQASYRIVAADKRSPRDGRFLEILGHYNPRTEPSTVRINDERLFFWMQRGAQPSESVTKILKPLGTWERWERFKKGEALEKLLEEAKAAVREVDPRTRRDDLVAERAAKAKPKKAAPKVVEKEPKPAPKADEEAAAPVAKRSRRLPKWFKKML